MATTSNAASECEARPGTIDLAVTGHYHALFGKKPGYCSCWAADVAMSGEG